mgnify:CR=1 FL=1
MDIVAAARGPGDAAGGTGPLRFVFVVALPVPRGPVGAGRSSSLVAPAGLPHTAGRSNACGIPSRGRVLHAASGVRRASPPVPSSVVRPGFWPLFGPRDRSCSAVS